jgi:hypothetical protein
MSRWGYFEKLCFIAKRVLEKQIKSLWYNGDISKGKYRYKIRGHSLNITSLDAQDSIADSGDGQKKCLGQQRGVVLPAG